MFRLVGSDLIRTNNSTILYQMRMPTEANMPYDYLMSRPTVHRLLSDSLYAAWSWETVSWLVNFVVDKGNQWAMFLM